MENLDIFLFFVVSPILVGLVVLMVVIAKKATKIDNFSQDHISTENERFEYKKREFKGLDNKVDSLRNVMSTDIIHPLKEVNERINLWGVEATVENIDKSFKDWGFNHQRVGDKSFLIRTSFHDLKISILIYLDTERQILEFQSFCYAFEEINENVYKLINEFNNSTIVGHLELKEYSNRYLPMYTYALMLSDNKISKHNITETLRYIGYSLKDLFAGEKKLEFKVILFLFDDYLRLELGEEKYKELTEKASSETENKNDDEEKTKANNGS